MPLMFSANYGSEEKATQAGSQAPAALRNGFYRIFRRLDGRYELVTNTKQVVSQHWTLVAVYELDSKSSQWIRIV
jgi:hypothetical protein